MDEEKGTNKLSKMRIRITRQWMNRMRRMLRIKTRRKRRRTQRERETTLCT